MALGTKKLLSSGCFSIQTILLDVRDADEYCSYVYKCVKNIRGALPASIPLIGFCGSPWTLAAYSLEGSSSKDFAFTRSFISENSIQTQELLKKYTDACFEYLKEQVIAQVIKQIDKACIDNNGREEIITDLVI